MEGILARIWIESWPMIRIHIQKVFFIVGLDALFLNQAGWSLVQTDKKF
jgi:hypothetical protein